MRVGILGPLQIELAHGRVELGGSRLPALLSRLALGVGHPVSVEALIETLWPDGQPSDPQNALHTLVSRLRRALQGTGDNPPVRGTPHGYVLDVPTEQVDALLFERLVRQGRHALRDGSPESAASTLRRALALWRGTPLDGISPSPFTRATAARLSELRLVGVEDRVEADLCLGAGPLDLVAELEEYLVTHPLREQLRSLHVRALHVGGRHAEALAAYEEFRTLLVEELGTSPGPDLQAAHLAVLRHEPSQSSAAPGRPASPPTHGNIRAALSSFVGREVEQQLVQESFRAGRLVTLVGPGGSGKTRLASTVAHETAERYAGGAWLVELAPVTDPAEVTRAVADALLLRRGDGRPYDAASLAEELSASETLLVLDNCEHLLDAVAGLVEELLGRCQRLRVLATSREALRIGGEALCPVLPLAVPTAGESLTEAAHSPAVRLFTDRAVAVAPNFVLTEDNVPLVTEICCRLDGLPLAIELAAAWVRSIPLAELATQLHGRFHLLTSGNRTALPRHQTLRAVFAWSWDLLTDDERNLAQRLAVFPGTVTPQSAEAVYTPISADSPSALHVLSALMDKSLLQRTKGPGTRYHMLESTREYGLECLAAAGELARARAAHAAYFLHLAERAEPGLRGADQLGWLRHHEAEHDNLLGAFHFVRESGDASATVRMAAALGYFWTIERNHTEAANTLRTALEVPGPSPQRARTDATLFLVINAMLSGGAPPDSLEVLCERARAGTTGALDHHFRIIEAYRVTVTGERSSDTEAMELPPEPPEPWSRGMLQLFHACFHASKNDTGRARELLDAGARSFGESGDRWGHAVTLGILAHTLAVDGDLDGATTGLEEAVLLLDELGAGSDGTMERVWLAEMCAHRGDTDRARRDLLAIVSGSGHAARHDARARILLGDLARWEGDLTQAATEYRLARERLDASAVPQPQLRAALCVATGMLALAHDQWDAAGREFTDGLRWSDDHTVNANLMVGMATLRARQGATTAAAELLGTAHALRGGAAARHPDVERAIRKVSDKLGAALYEKAYTGGKRLDRATLTRQLAGET